jgi:hypothetical protein
MNKLLGFVPKLLGLVDSGLDVTKDGVKALTDVSKEHPKKSGIVSLLLGWLVLDPTALHTVGAYTDIVANWLMKL